MKKIVKTSVSGFLRLLLIIGFSGMAVIRASADDGKQIANVVQRGNFAYVYDAKGSQVSVIPAGN